MMKQTTRLLALSAFVLAVILAAFGVPALEAPNVAFAQVPDAPTLAAQRSGASTINLSWNTVNGAVRYQLYAWDAVDGWERLDGGAANPLSANTFAHQNLVADRLFFYQVAAVDAQGNRGAWSARANEVAGQNAPGRPVLTATPGYQLNTITWPEVSGATSYLLYAWDGGWSQVGGTLSTNSYTHSGLNVGQVYYYQARATNANGITGAWSAQVAATVLSSPTISAPRNLRAAIGNLQVTLTWQAPANTGGSTITGYEYRYAASDATLPDTWADAGNDLTETVMNLTNGTSYTFEVRALSSSGVGPAARAMQTPATAPAAPVLTATEGYRQVILNWAAPANNGAAISSYRIEKLNAQAEWALEANLPGSATTYTDRGLSDSTSHTYRIFAVNADGDGEASNSADATTLAQQAQVPSAPTSSTEGVVIGAGKITLNWAPPALTGGASISRYEYRYKTDGSFGSWKRVGLVLKAEVTPLKPNVEYTFEVRAVNSVGAGEALELTGTPTPTGPTAAPRLRALLGEDDDENAQVTLSWDALGPAQNGGSTITDYELCYKKSTGSEWMRWDDNGTGFTEPAVNDSGQLWSAIHGAAGAPLDPGTSYQYRARALNMIALAGDDDDTCDHEGPWSNVAASAATEPVAPGAPTLHPAAGVSDIDPPQAAWDLDVNSITIRWTEPGSTGGPDITSYEIWVGVSMVSEQDDIAELEPNVTGLPGARMEFVHVGLQADTTYYYRVRARNGSGDSRVSLWSDEQFGLTATTQLGTPGAPTAVSGTHADGIVTVGWTAPLNAGSLPITYYEVQYQRDDDDDDDDWSDATIGRPNPPTNPEFEHANPDGGSMYEYRVRAVNGHGAGAWSGDPSGTPTRAEVPARAPAAPMLTATALGMDEILLEWTIPQDNGTEIGGFSIQQWNPDGDGGVGAWDTTTNLLDNLDNDDEKPGLTLHTVMGLMAGIKHYYRIQALPTGDWSEMADAASATTVAGVPAKPERPTLVVGTGDDAGSITVSWVQDPLLETGGSDITGYELRVWDGSAWALEANPAADETSYKDDDLAPGKRYHYILSAINMIGYGPWSDDGSAVTAPGVPDAPMLTATATGRDSIQLTWTVPDANGATITGYELQKWANGSWDANLLETGDTVTEYVDTMLMAGTKYYYRVRAMPQEGQEGWSATDMDDADSETTQGNTPGRPTWAPGTTFPVDPRLAFRLACTHMGGAG